MNLLRCVGTHVVYSIRKAARSEKVRRQRSVDVVLSPEVHTGWCSATVSVGDSPAGCVGVFGSCR